MTKLAKSLNIIEVLLEVGDHAKAEQVASSCLKDIVQLAKIADKMRNSVRLPQSNYEEAEIDELELVSLAKSYDSLLKG